MTNKTEYKLRVISYTNISNMQHVHRYVPYKYTDNEIISPEVTYPFFLIFLLNPKPIFSSGESRKDTILLTTCFLCLIVCQFSLSSWRESHGWLDCLVGCACKSKVRLCIRNANIQLAQLNSPIQSQLSQTKEQGTSLSFG